jgi:glutathione S-transferase
MDTRISQQSQEHAIRSASKSSSAQINRHGLLLYDFGGSPCARRVRISLMEKGLSWDTQTIDLSRLEQRSSEYLAINPNGLVPTLAHGERVIWESNVITQYLDDMFPERPLYPQDPWPLAQVRMWQAAEQAMAKDYRPLMYQRLIGPILRLKYSLEEALAVAARSTTNIADLDWERRVWSLTVLTPTEQGQAEERLYHWLDKVELALQQQDFLVGCAFTQAEISIYPRVAMYPYIGLQVSEQRYPCTRVWLRRLESRPSFPRTQTPHDRAILLFARSGLLPWIADAVARAPQDRSIGTRMSLTALKALIRRVTTPDEPLSGLRPTLKKPAVGVVPPGIGRFLANQGRSARPAQSASGLVLYEHETAPECARIRLLLNELGLPYVRRSIDLGRLEHKASAVLRMNPFGELPILEHGGRILYDSGTIAEYLVALAGDRHWFPTNALPLAQVRMWLAFDAGMHKEFRPLYWLHILRPALLREGASIDTLAQWAEPGVDPSHVDWLRSVLQGQPRFDSSAEHARSILAGKLARIEQELGKHAWIAGEQSSFADLALYTRFAVFPALGIAFEPNKLPRVADWMRRLQSLPTMASLVASRG